MIKAIAKRIAGHKLSTAMFILNATVVTVYLVSRQPTAAPHAAVATLRGTSPNCLKFNSQFGQDEYIYQNDLLPSNNGFYIDLGAYHPSKYSNTAFLDKCRGWKGLCIDMNQFHKEEFAKERTCEFIHTCVSKNRSHADYYLQDNDLADGKEGTSRSKCQPFSVILNQSGVQSVDFLSVDIEGGEMGALESFPFDRIQPSVILIETWRSGKEPIFDFLEDRGYRHVAELGPDDLFVWSGRSPWLPQRYKEWRFAVRAQKED